MKAIKAEIIRGHRRVDIVYTLVFENTELSMIIDCLDSVYGNYDELDDVLLGVDEKQLAKVLDKLRLNFDRESRSSVVTLTSDDFSYIIDVFVHMHFVKVDFDILDLEYSAEEIEDFLSKLDKLDKKLSNMDRLEIK